MLYLIALGVLAVLYFTEVIEPRDRLGTVPTPVVWFGALGAVVISLTGVFYHYADWLPSYRYWHWARPLIGAAVAVIAVLIFQAGILAVGVEPETAKNDLLYYVIAFFVGYQEAAFREMMARVGEVILRPGGATAEAVPTITSVEPSPAPAGAPAALTIRGTGLGRTNSVTFDDDEVTTFEAVADRYVKLIAPARAAGPVVITVVTNDGETAEHDFQFT
jgi:hypothetical protein